MINRTRKGHVYPTYRYEVSRAKIEEYATATGYALPDRNASPVVAPQMFAACFTVMQGAGLLRGDPELRATAPVVHAQQDYDFGRPVRSGDVLDCTPRITEIVDRGAHTYLTLAIECAEAGTGQQIVTSRQTIVYLGAAEG